MPIVGITCQCLCFYVRKQAEATRGKPMQSTEWPPLLPPPRTLADPASAAASPADARFIMSQFLQKITSGGYSRRANAVFRVASTREKYSIPNCGRRALEASQCSLSGDPPPFPMLTHDSCHEPDLSVRHASNKNCCSLLCSKYSVRDRRTLWITCDELLKYPP